MNIRKQRKKANNRVARFIVRRDRMIEPIGEVTDHDFALSQDWIYATRKAKR